MHDTAKLNQILQHPIPSTTTPPGSYYSQTQTESKAINDLISLSDEVISQLEADLSYVRKFKAYQTSLIVPICRLPNELLGVIFTHTLSGTFIDIGRKSGAIWDLLEVCARWRDVAESTPELWSKFKIGSLIDTKRSDVTLRVQQCLKLSGVTPLAISLLPATLRSIPKQVIGDIFAEAHRWLYLKTYSEMFYLPNNIPNSWSSLTVGLHQLRELHLQKSQGDGLLISFLNNILHDPVMLETLTMHHLILDELLGALVTVKRLKLRMCIGSSFLFTVSKMPNLEELTCIRHDFRTVFREQQPIQNIMLASLHTINVSTVEVDQAWSKFSVPQLTTFRLQNCARNVDIFLQVIKDSSSVIKRLRLDYCTTDTNLSVLLQLHDVEELTISLMPSYEGLNLIFLALVWNSPQTLVPSLRTLVINIVKENEDPTIPFHIMSIISSRSARTISGLEERGANVPVPLTKLICNVETSSNDLPSEDFIYAYSATLKRAGSQAGADVEVLIKTAAGDVISDTTGEDVQRENDGDDLEMEDVSGYNNSDDDRGSHAESIDYRFGEDEADYEDFDEDDTLD